LLIPDIVKSFAFLTSPLKLFVINRLSGELVESFGIVQVHPADFGSLTPNHQQGDEQSDQGSFHPPTKPPPSGFVKGWEDEEIVGFERGQG
jgi:hypothetical protein